MAQLCHLTLQVQATHVLLLCGTLMMVGAYSRAQAKDLQNPTKIHGLKG